MTPKLTVCLLALCLFGCSEKSKSQEGDASLEASTKPEAGAKPEAGQKPDGSSSWVLTRTKTDAAMPNYDEVAEEACNLAGGICDNSGENCSPVPLENGSCGPGRIGVMCCRPAPEPDCAPPDAVCCEEGGLFRKVVVVCDRGYPSCGIPGYFVSSDGSCNEGSRVPFATEDAPSKWENAISAAQAVRLTCEKYGGKIVSKNESCDRVMLGLESRTQICCATEASCPDEYVNSECCNESGEVEKKACFDGRFSCAYSAIGSGSVREVEVGTCKPFDIDS